MCSGVYCVAYVKGAEKGNHTGEPSAKNKKEHRNRHMNTAAREGND